MIFTQPPAGAGDRLDLDILIVPGVTLMLTAAVLEPLRAANRLMGRTLFSWRILTPDGAPVRTESGIDVSAEAAFRADGANPLVILGSYRIEDAATPSLIRRLRAARRHRPTIGAVETGVILAARAGLLTGCPVAVHWEDRAALIEEHGSIDVRPDRFVVTQTRFTAGGAAPTLDMMIELVRCRHGVPLALELSRSFIYDPHGSGDGRLPVESRLDPRVTRALTSMEDHISDPRSIEQIAKGAGVSGRHLHSLFLQAFGIPPKTFYLSLRLNRARRLILETQIPFASIADQTGFSDAGAFSTRYTTHYNETPTQTRRASRTQTTGNTPEK